jgi:hypothetical protein
MTGYLWYRGFCIHYVHTFHTLFIILYWLFQVLLNKYLKKCYLRKKIQICKEFVSVSHKKASFISKSLGTKSLSRFFLFICFCYVVQAGHELDILLNPKYWNYRPVSSSPVNNSLLRIGILSDYNLVQS